MIPIKTLSKENFRKYGVLLEPKNKSRVFTVLCGDKGSQGWRIGYVMLGPEKVRSLEAHPESDETFEPVFGISILLVAEKCKPDCIEAFLLDKGVLVKKGVWHGLRVLSEKAGIKVTENFEVKSVFHKLKKPIDINFV
ncbi:MAG: hypothetical protein KA120_03655 [Candidatus Goldbacteria bacterium]|nr:hypothetical protein [Candidatus Goldiibacteriota bacterium]